MTQLGYFGVAFAARDDGAGVPHAPTTSGPPHQVAYRREERAVPSGRRRSVASRRLFRLGTRPQLIQPEHRNPVALPVEVSLPFEIPEPLIDTLARRANMRR